MNLEYCFNALKRTNGQNVSKIYFVKSFVFLLLMFGFFSESWAGPTLSGERSRNLKTLSQSSFLYEMHSETISESAQHFYYPRRDSSWRKNYKTEEKDALMQFDNERAAIFGSFVGGLDYRGGEVYADTMFPAADGGVYLRGFIDSLEFELDARIYTESHSADRPASYDGEFVEFQKEENNAGVEYASYARYRGHIALNAGFARLDFGRDVAHFGPGYYNNLTLNQFAIPFNMFTLELQVGPLTVYSLYGDLRIYPNSMSMKNKDQRDLYAHRYELNFGNLVLGMSEIQVIYDNENAWLFVPIVPLFMEKGNFSENSNNGALAFDINYRFSKFLRLYSEFFIDDFESPISLVKNDNAEAKWAFLGGLQMAKNFYFKNNLLEMGTLAEYARVEPYVYTHFIANTAQLAHLGQPLGNQGGPNSQTIDWLLYARLNKRWTFGAHQTWFWKGTDYGSALNDTTPNNHYKFPKKFLDGAQMEYSLTPMLGYEGQFVSFQLEWTFFDRKKFFTRVGFKW